MPDLDLLAIAVATIAAFVLGGAYYATFGAQLAEVSDAAPGDEAMPPWKIAVELGRCLILASVVAGLASQGEIDELGGGLALGAALWIGFPLVLWTGAVVHDSAPVKLAVIHAGDWLAKLVVVGAIVAVVQ